MKKEMVSIILPTYNRAELITDAIESVLNQSYPWFELLIIDDASTDDTDKVVKQYEDERIRYYRMSENGGASKARNFGMRKACYDYIAFEDSDDLWNEDKLLNQMQEMLGANEEVGMVYHKMQYSIAENISIILPEESIPLKEKSGDIFEQLLWDNLVGMPTMLIRRACLETVGFLDESLKALEDYDFALRIAKKFKIQFIDKTLLSARYSTTGVSGDSANYLVASCMLVGKYKLEYARTETLNHRLKIILQDAKRMNMETQIISLLEKVLQV